MPMTQAQMNTMLQVLNQFTQSMEQMVQFTAMQAQAQMVQPPRVPPLPVEPSLAPPMPMEQPPLMPVMMGHNDNGGNSSQNVSQGQQALHRQMGQPSLFGGR